VPSDLFEQARAAWPGVALTDDDFEAHVATRVGARANSASAVRMPELFLACACAKGDPTAIAHFESTYFADIEILYRRFDRLPAALDDVRQRLRGLLFLADPPAVAGYSGAGELRSWLRTTALHLLVNISNREGRERPTDVAFFDAIVDSSPDLETSYLKEACRAEFDEALCASLKSLEPRDRALLRYAFADGATVDQIGAVYRVHRATAARWVAAARDLLVERTRAELMDRLKVSETEAGSIVRAALSRMGGSLLRRLA
jgi:RNA polymerase sigma-70 factor (ECF subfamily)